MSRKVRTKNGRSISIAHSFKFGDRRTRAFTAMPCDSRAQNDREFRSLNPGPQVGFWTRVREWGQTLRGIEKSSPGC